MNANTQPPLATIAYEEPDHWVWCPSITQDANGRWHLFASRWPKAVPFHPGWLLASEIIRAEADRPEGPYRFMEVVMTGRGADWWDGRSVHNPAVIRDGDRWVLFYMGSTHPFADPTLGADLPVQDPRVVVARWRERLGVATAPGPAGPWTRRAAPLLDARPECFDSWITSNPTACRTDAGGWLLVYKARSTRGTPGDPKHGPMALATACAAVLEGPWERSPQPVWPRDGIGEVEDPFVWRSARGYELIFKDMGDRLTGCLHALVRAWSPDGLTWQLDHDPLFSDRRVHLGGDGLLTLGSLERPSLVFQNGSATHLVAAAADGPGWFQSITRSFVITCPPPRDEVTL